MSKTQRYEWGDIKSRLNEFVRKWADYDAKEIAGSQSFWNDLLCCFDETNRKKIQLYEHSIKKLSGSKGRIDLFIPGLLLVEQKNPSTDVNLAKQQALDYCAMLNNEELPRFIVLCNFKEFKLIDLLPQNPDDAELNFTLQQLPQYMQRFWFLTEHYHEAKYYEDMDEASVAAATQMAKLYQSLVANPLNKKSDDLDLFMVRLLFCLFADGTNIFDNHRLKKYLEAELNDRNGGEILNRIFRMLNVEQNERQSSGDLSLDEFEYINGNLFADEIYSPSFNKQSTDQLKACLAINWAPVHPAIFGSLFQDINSADERHALGEHYTSERNILKTLDPLFLDDYEQKLAEAGSNEVKLQHLQNQLSTLTFFDPACGCGNFLVVAYKKLRELELKIIKKLYPPTQQLLDVDASALSVVDVDQFYGIEINAFAAKIAQVAMWLTDHQQNTLLGNTYGQYVARIPLVKSAYITCDNALRSPWVSLQGQKPFNYIMGNPPFLGYDNTTADQKKESKAIMGSSGLDYVANWYYLALAYCKTNPTTRCAFVSTNSITQGEQVHGVWKALLTDGLVINFAHRTFSWFNEAAASTTAKVHVVIIGFSLAQGASKIKTLWDYDDLKGEGAKRTCANINPYLIAGPNILVEKRRYPLDRILPSMYLGNVPRDDGNFFLTPAEKDGLLAKEPLAKEWIRPVLGSKEFINNTPRYVLWLKHALPSQLQAMPHVIKRVEAIQQFRAKSTRAGTRKAADTPTLFSEERQPSTNYLLIPAVSSERRTYVPIGYIDKDTICTNANFTLPNATPYMFACLTSLMHMVWMRYTCGRLESRYRYSNTIVYNNFPFPPKPNATQLAKIEALAQALLEVRNSYFEQGQSYANLYNPTTMPQGILKAHQQIDKAIDALYRKEPFTTELERMAFLFEEYEKRINTLGL